MNVPSHFARSSLLIEHCLPMNSRAYSSPHGGSDGGGGCDGEADGGGDGDADGGDGEADGGGDGDGGESGGAGGGGGGGDGDADGGGGPGHVTFSGSEWQRVSYGGSSFGLYRDSPVFESTSEYSQSE